MSLYLSAHLRRSPSPIPVKEADVAHIWPVCECGISQRPTRNCARGCASTFRTPWRTAVFEFSFRSCGLRIFSIVLRNCGCFLVSGLAIARCLGECRSLRSRARLTSRRADAIGSPAVMLTASPIVSATRSATAVEGREIIFPKEFQRRGALWVYLSATAVSDNWRPFQCAPAPLHHCKSTVDAQILSR